MTSYNILYALKNTVHVHVCKCTCTRTCLCIPPTLSLSMHSTAQIDIPFAGRYSRCNSCVLRKQNNDVNLKSYTQSINKHITTNTPKSLIGTTYQAPKDHNTFCIFYNVDKRLYSSGINTCNNSAHICIIIPPVMYTSVHVATNGKVKCFRERESSQTLREGPTHWLAPEP